MPIKRRLAKHRADLPVQTWTDLTIAEQAWLRGDPEPVDMAGWRYGEWWGFSDAAHRDLWRPGRPTGDELLDLFGDEADLPP
jgi:hypothetical protein